MLCSVPAGKSGSNWLDRLRSRKGLPTGDDLDLDYFLSNQNLNASFDSPTPAVSNSPQLNPESTQSDHEPVLTDGRDPQMSSFQFQNGEPELFGLMTNVLSELFNMGSTCESSKLSGKKFPRKQTNPRNCSISERAVNTNSDLVCVQKDVNVLSSNSDNSLKGEEKVKAGNGEVEDYEEEEEEEEEEGKRELVGYSRSELTVIDTSEEVWKSDKLVFRRKNVWKVRERKGRLMKSLGRKKKKKKRKQQVNDHLLPTVNKKAKILDEEECVKPNSNQEGQKSQDDSKGRIVRRPHRQSGNRGSSVIPNKGIISTDKKIKNRVVDNQRQLKPRYNCRLPASSV